MIIATLIVVLLGVLVFQNNIISNLKDKNNKLSQTISKQEEANKNLIRNLELEREAVTSYQQAVTSLREKANETKQSINQALKNEKCANTLLPDDISKRLQSIGHH
ncbi:DUF2570 family protein [Pasteurella atlantica]|uniref:DUF2570 family protein n=2 Tax=Pasteurellaceae TaxID=712 RepID=A0ACC6HJI5_9PAST|nr:DUF2570 family protein [Pasteurella atlantica]MDP8051042.1 DUF2570 family protein [Pasteurella atlantica]MDP8104338.1 DUF2570 family protein [Pasteurella atlantica]MDP8147698.1 DUF2570 family protein [Pasteurella atlantica]